MAEIGLVRPSRDGDQFHYVWAARRCLLLLQPLSQLVAIAIEGVSPRESAQKDGPAEGEEVIDVAEYYGSEGIANASRIVYVQLKHSTLRAAEPWIPSDLKKSLRGFSKRYKAFRDRGAATAHLEFHVVSNRPFRSEFLESLGQIACEQSPSDPSHLTKLEKYTGLTGPELAQFCRQLYLRGGQDDYWMQRNFLSQEVSGYLPDADVDAPIQLKELITRKALSQSAELPTITKTDVLRALGTDATQLFPADCLIEDSSDTVPRQQQADIVAQIEEAAAGPIIIHADGGVGKSILASQIRRAFSGSSLCILYDCFGNGRYRNTSCFRHRHKEGLVQIANELAGFGLCHPLIPTASADPTSYLKAFLHRARQAITSLKHADDSALLVIIIDAADNAQMAAEEIGDSRSFPRDLLREQLPEGVRLVVTSRTHRKKLLDAPPNAVEIALHPFTLSETEHLLRHAFPDATQHDVHEFHRLSSHNPRVQSLALSGGGSLENILRKLGPNPTTVQKAIEDLLDQAIERLRHAYGPIEQGLIERICAGLAALRPLVPISVLSAMSGVDATAIKSFAFDLGRPLVVTGDTIQFFDEPAETWFRERFKPAAKELADFVASLEPLASGSAYVASVLPQLMLEAGLLNRLIELALSSNGLPESSPVERRDVELQRLQFALKATLRESRFVDAAKIALKAGGESAGDSRQRSFFQRNTDLASVLMDIDRIQEIVSRRTFGSVWVGSHHVYEAGLLSGRVELQPDARSRLRMAAEWLRNWSRLDAEDRQREPVSYQDIAELALAHLNVHGATSCIDAITGWRPRSIAFYCGRLVASRLIDHERYDALDELAFAAGNHLCLILGIAIESRAAYRTLPPEVVKRSLRLLQHERVHITNSVDWDDKYLILQGVTSLVESGAKLADLDHAVLANVLSRYLPAKPQPALASRYYTARGTLLRAYALRAELAKEALAAIDLATPELREELEDTKGHSRSRDADEFLTTIGSLLPWHKMKAACTIGKITTDVIERVISDVAKEARSHGGRYSGSDLAFINNEVALLWQEALLEIPGATRDQLDSLNRWLTDGPFFTSTLIELSRRAARSEAGKQYALEYAERAFQITKPQREDAEQKSGTYLDIARAVLTISKSESSAYFNQAVEVAGKIGDENLVRWDAMIGLAKRSSGDESALRMLASRFGRTAELTYDYVARDKHFPWFDTVEALTTLSPSSLLAILSRWRDRHFGRFSRLLPLATNSLVARSILSPLDAASLIGFQCEWSLADILKSALQARQTKESRVRCGEILLRYLRVEQHSLATWREIRGALARGGLDVSWLDELVSESEVYEQAKRKDRGKDSQLQSFTSSEPSRRWDDVFGDVRLSTLDGLVLAYRRFRAGNPPFDHELFFEEAARRVPPGREGEYITAVTTAPIFDLYHLQKFIESLPATWSHRLSAQAALSGGFKAICRRHCVEIRDGQGYSIFPLAKMSALAGVSADEAIGIVLSSIGVSSDVLDAGQLFTLVGLISAVLAGPDACAVLSYGLDLMEESITDADGDGPEGLLLDPGENVTRSLAGLIWSALAAPESELRWEAAHVVRVACELNRGELVKHLMDFAASDGGGAFADPRLPFYTLHARLWFWIAIARVANTNPTILVPYVDFLSEPVTGNESHVLIRGFAAQAVSALIAQDLVDASSVDKDGLENINRARPPLVYSRQHERSHSEESRDSEGHADDPGFFFGIDFGPYVLKPLAQCFGTTQGEIERMAWRVIRSEWMFPAEDGRIPDARSKRGFYRDGDSYASHGAKPRMHDLDYYLSYHAMMVVAGRLLESRRVHSDPDEVDDDFAMWLREHGLARADNCWLSDRRDPRPLHLRPNLDDHSQESIRYSVASDDFLRVATDSADRITLWGNWTSIVGDTDEAVHVSSALVSENAAYALLRALQTASDFNDYRLPEAGDDPEIDSGPLQLRGWVRHDRRSYGLDDEDPWSGDIAYPSIVPSKYVVDSMLLRSDAESRVWWKAPPGQTEALWSEVWGEHEDRRDQETVERGSRLRASKGFLVDLLANAKMKLIIKVEIERRPHRRRYQSGDESDAGYVLPYVRILLAEADGQLITL